MIAVSAAVGSGSGGVRVIGVPVLKLETIKTEVDGDSGKK